MSVKKDWRLWQETLDARTYTQCSLLRMDANVTACANYSPTEEPEMEQNARTAAQAALEAYRAAKGHRSNDAEDLVDLVSDLAHLADLSDDPDLTGADLLLESDVAEDTAGEGVLSSAFDNYRAEK